MAAVRSVVIVPSPTQGNQLVAMEAMFLVFG